RDILQAPAETMIIMDVGDQHPHPLRPWRLRVVTVELENQLGQIADAKPGNGFRRRLVESVGIVIRQRLGITQPPTVVHQIPPLDVIPWFLSGSATSGRSGKTGSRRSGPRFV